MHACGEIWQAKGLCFMQRNRGSISSSSSSRATGGNSSSNTSSTRSSGTWNLSLECVHDKSIAECSFGLEVRGAASQQHRAAPSSYLPSLQREAERMQNSSSSGPLLARSSVKWKFGAGSDAQEHQPSKPQTLDTGPRFWERIRNFQTIIAQGFVNCGPPPLPPTSTSVNVFLGILAFVVVAGILRFRDSIRFKKRGVKNRILKSRWFNDSRSATGKRKLDETPRWANKSPKSEVDDFPMLDRLVIHDGEVIRGKQEPTTKNRRRSFLTQAGADHIRRIRNEDSSGSAPSPPLTGNSSRIRKFLTKAGGRARPLFRNSREPNVEAAKDTSQQGKWNAKDEHELKEHIEELRQSVQAAESNRKAAIQALAEERKRSLELEVKIRRQKEAAIALEEEVRVLKESHEALLNSLRKKYSSSAAARAAAALLYQNWESGETAAEV